MSLSARCGICKREVEAWDAHRQSDEHLANIEARLDVLDEQIATAQAEFKTLLKAAAVSHALRRRALRQ